MTCMRNRLKDIALKHGMAVAVIALGMTRGVAFAGTDLVTGTSAPLSVDTRALSERRALTNELVRYSPRYVTATNVPGAYVVLKKVVAGESGASVTSTVATCAAGAEGGLPLELGASDSRFLSLLHEVHAEDGALIGLPLAVDMVYGYAGTSAAGTFCDTTKNGVQVLADARKTIPLVYSTDWTNDVASVAITCVKATRANKRSPYAAFVTNAVFLASATADGVCDFATATLDEGDYSLLYTMKDADGQPIGKPLVATFSYPQKWGLLLLFK